MFSVLIDRFSTEHRVWEWNKDNEWVIMILHKSFLLTNESHYQVNHNEQTHSEIRSSWNDLSSPSDTKKINEKLIDIDLFVLMLSQKPISDLKNQFLGENTLKLISLLSLIPSTVIQYY